MAHWNTVQTLHTGSFKNWHTSHTFYTVLLFTFTLYTLYTLAHGQTVRTGTLPHYKHCKTKLLHIVKTVTGTLAYLNIVHT